MSHQDAEIAAIEWANDLTDPQIRALAHQVGIAGSVTYPVDKLRKHLKERKRLKKIIQVRKEIYG